MRVLNTHNVEHHLYLDLHRWRSRWLREAVRRIEVRAAEACDILVTCSLGDKTFFEANARVRESVLVPNGIDVRRFLGIQAQRVVVRQELGIADDALVFLFTASRWAPNEEAFARLRDFTNGNRQFLADRRIHILVVGGVTAVPERTPSFTATGKVDRVEPYFAAADAALNPLSSGAGTNVKMSEFLAHRLPVVTTPLGARGFRIEDGKTGFLFEHGQPRVRAFEGTRALRRGSGPPAGDRRDRIRCQRRGHRHGEVRRAPRGSDRRTPSSLAVAAGCYTPAPASNEMKGGEEVPSASSGPTSARAVAGPHPSEYDAEGSLPERPSSRFSGHVASLDGVRGLAILAVLLYHFVAQTTATNPLERAVNKVLNYGALGVDLFFILSGFLITGILYDARGEPGYFRNFYMRRLLRIFPLYYAVLAVVFLVVPALPALRGSEIAGLQRHQVWAWTYGVNVYLALEGQWALSYIEHFWSLAVEEHFYLVWPLVVWLLAERPRRLMGAALIIALLSFAGRVAAASAGVNLVATTVLTPFQLDALCLGGFFAVYARQSGGERAIRRVILPMALFGGAVLLFDFWVRRLTGWDVLVRTGMYHLVLAALLLTALTAPAASLVSRVFESGPMVALGKYSYGLYVYHHFVSYYVVKHGTEFALARVVGSHTVAVLLLLLLGMAVSFAVAWLSYECFEKHFLHLKRFWPSSKERSAPVGAVGPMVEAPTERRVG